MLSKVSWGAFLSVTALLVVVYYLVILAMYFRKEITAFLSKLGKSNQSGNKTIDEGGDPTIEELEDVVADLRYSVLEKTGRSCSKDELLRLIGRHLQNYHGIKKPAFRVALNNYIIRHADDICGITLSEDDLNEIWKNY